MRNPLPQRKLAAALAMLLGMATVAFGQTVPDSTREAPPGSLSVGAFAGLGRSVEIGEVLAPEIAACDTLRSGSSSLYRLGLLADLPISSSIALQARLGIAMVSGELRATGHYPPVLVGEDGLPVAVAFDQVLTFRRTSVAAAIVARYLATDQPSLVAGLEFARQIGGRQELVQEAVSPETFLFGNRQRSFTIRSGEIIPSAPIVASVMLGAGWQLPIARRSWLIPELLVSLPITSTARQPWRSIAATLGAAIRFELPSVPTPQPPDTLVIVQRAPVLEASVLTSPEIVEVRVDEYDSLEFLPLLNQIFFPEGSASIPPRYHLLYENGATSYSAAALQGSALDVYHDMLNIIGSRLRTTPEATLTIRGYHNGRESDPQLSRERADTIRRYLFEEWGISRKRLRVVPGGLPPSPASESFEEGFEENARVEIEASDPNITAPVLRRHIQRVATPPLVVFFPSARAEAGLRSWRLDVLRDSALWRRFEGTGPLPDSIRWDWRSNSKELPTIPMQLGYRLTVADLAGQSATTPRSDIRVRYESLQQKLENRQNDTLIESFSLLLFNYDSPRVSEADQELLRAIAARIRPGATVMITGFTDSLGVEAHNRELANARASETARILRGLVPRGVTMIVSDLGGEHERFPYDTPEGRSHCRTVVIDIRTPAEPQPR